MQKTDLSKSVFSPLGTRPIDRMALAGILPGECWEPPIPQRFSRRVLKTPPRCRPVPIGYEQYVGMVRGKLTAVGLLNYNQNNKPFWLMRCDCGQYEARHIDGWIKRPGIFDQCIACETTASISHVGRSAQRHGIRHAKWVKKLKAHGFSDPHIGLIEQYSLPTDDLDWLLKVVQSLNVAAGA